MRQLKILRLTIHKILRNIHTFIRWGLLAAATGLVIGGFSTLFAASLRFVTDFRTERPWMIFFCHLPAFSSYFVRTFSI